MKNDRYEDISVAFYFNNKSSKNSAALGGGIEKWFKNGMQYWHTEIAFPGNLFLSSSSSDSVDRLFAFGVFSDQTDTFICRSIRHISDYETVLYDIDGYTLSLKSYSKPKKILNQKFYRKDMGMVILSGNMDNHALTYEKIQFCGPVDMQWNSQNRLGGRVNRYNLKNVVLEYNYETRVAQLKSPGMVFGKPRDFSNPNYRWIHFSVPMENVMEALLFAKEQIGKPHDDYGTYKAMLFPGKPNYKTYYCVNFVACVLQKAGFLHGINPNVLLPDDLYILLKNHPDTITNFNPYVLRSKTPKAPILSLENKKTWSFAKPKNKYDRRSQFKL